MTKKLEVPNVVPGCDICRVEERQGRLFRVAVATVADTPAGIQAGLKQAGLTQGYHWVKTIGGYELWKAGPGRLAIKAIND